MRARRYVLFLFFLAFASLYGYGVEVDEQELTSSPSDVIQFQNYSGPVIRFETDTQIRGIGASLAGNLPSIDEDQIRPGTAVFAGKYRVTRIPPGGSGPLRGADILELLPQAAVDHIDNLRRIISGYLEAAFGYSRQDAETLSFFVTIYNAVHRGAVDRFSQRYTPEVMASLNPEKVGLSLVYSEWAGASQIVIPLSLGAGPGQLSSLPADELASPEVVENLRDSSDQGIEERQQVSELIDRAVEQEQDQIAETRTALDAEQQEIEREQQDLAERQAANQAAQDQAAQQQAEAEQRRAEAEANSDSEAAAAAQRDADAAASQSEQLADEAETLEEEQRDIEQRQAAAEAEEAELDTRQAQAEAAQERSDEIREETAQDIQQTQTAAAPVPVLFPATRIANGVLLSKFSFINAQDGSGLNREAPIDIVGRSLVSTSAGLLGITPGSDADRGNLVLLDNSSLGELVRGTQPVAIQSAVHVDARNASVYAVVFQDGDWYLGQFDLTLNAVQFSVIPVQPQTSIVATDTAILVTRKDGRIARLTRTDLRVQ